MKITIISDTHHEHKKFGHLSGDVLIHCGDMFNLFSPNKNDVALLDEWFGSLDFSLILCTGGNHDLALEKRVARTSRPFKNAVYLQDQVFEHDGAIFYGAPWTPLLRRHAFYKDETGLRRAWSEIPQNVDVLITHTPPAGILDVSSRGLALGCAHLANAVAKTRPRIHCFGHVHASAGLHEDDDTTYVNASSVNSQFELARQPWVFEL